ncbi:pimeloyl-ACP methyl ester carboxylesterase [Duganella sp. 1224]|uniref:alpha/beta fold hydrolase n=1 Tax=Duganella sp. 1224 TaxID=2587052 RepID=UPI0015C8EBE0|nr:alpha/beta hydrolase [Duganella sp. 1224]NYE59413.1 pimeloyl-ACP methyl ester carboxylesterase [Duganella sp. 1224]
MTITAINTPNLKVDIRGRTLAYRSLGDGHPIVLCTRFRGTMDVWDPAFLDALAANGLRVITFDYSGIGQSSGEKSMHPGALANDAYDLIDALGLDQVVISGWSLGGMAAQIALAVYGQRISHAVLIGTTPPGHLAKPAEQLFYDTAVIPEYTLEDETILFFEPTSPASVAAARRSVARIAQRTEGRSPPVPLAWAAENLGSTPKNPLFPADAVMDALKTTTIPVLHVGGDHDIIFPVENWYALNQQLPTTQLLTFPHAGHGPHHQHPLAVAEYIASFVRNTSK